MEVHVTIDVRVRDKLLRTERTLVDCTAVWKGGRFTEGLTIDGRLHYTKSENRGENVI